VLEWERDCGERDNNLPHTKLNDTETGTKRFFFSFFQPRSLEGENYGGEVLWRKGRIIFIIYIL